MLGCLIEWFSHYHLSNQNLANSLPWRETSLVYTLSFSTPWLCTPMFPFLIANFKCLSLHTSLDDSQVSKLKPDLLPAINSSFTGRVQNKVSPGPQLTFSIWRSSLEGEPNCNLWAARKVELRCKLYPNAVEGLWVPKSCLLNWNYAIFKITSL